MFTGENRRKIITISIIIAIFIGWMFIDKSGILKNINLPQGNEWYFNLLDFMLPLTVTILAIWKKQKLLSVATGLILLSTIVEFCIKMNYFPNFMYFVMLALFFAGCVVFLWQSFNQRQTGSWVKWLGLIPAITGFAFLVLFPLDAGFYSVLIAVVSAVISFGAAAMCFMDRGQVLAFAAFLLMAFKYAGMANAWISTFTPVFAAIGYFLIGYSLTLDGSKGVDSIQ